MNNNIIKDSLVIPKDTSITFIGMPGAGKSYTSKILSSYYNIPCIELDENIEKEYNLTLPEIIKKYGENKFKEIETQAILNIDFSSQNIISTGGSVIYCNKGMKHLSNKNNYIVYLDTEYDLLKNRTENFTNRGIVFNNLTPYELYKERDLLYNKYANFKFNITDKNITQIFKF